MFSVCASPTGGRRSARRVLKPPPRLSDYVCLLQFMLCLPAPTFLSAATPPNRAWESLELPLSTRDAGIHVLPRSDRVCSDVVVMNRHQRWCLALILFRCMCCSLLCMDLFVACAALPRVDTLPQSSL
eukprot:scaffold201785_cov29-Tisochrysis_lutea.AAC.2